MKIVFFGTPSFSVPVLKAIIASRHTVAAVVSQPDRPKGRSMLLSPTPVRQAAVDAGISVLQPENASAPDFLSAYSKFSPDLNVIVAFGQILPEELIYLPRYATINIHASLLPKYRGASPINRALINGDTETGITYQFIVKKLDAGDIIYQEKMPIAPEDNAITLFEKLSVLSGNTVVKVLDMIESGTAPRVSQDESQATFVKTLNKSDGKIDFTQGAAGIVNKIRGLVPWPCAFCSYNGKILKIFAAREFIGETPTGKPGEIVEIIRNTGIVVSTGNGNVLVTELQPESGKKMTAAEFALGQKNILGSILS
jgi:methionyl-tRNA formyltransferase